MTTQDTCVTIVPYFEIHSVKLETAKRMCGQFVEKTKTEPKCLSYGFSFDGDVMHCREGYEDAGGCLAHLENVGALLGQLMTMANLTRLGIHGPKEQIDKLHTALGSFKPQFYTFEFGFRR